MFTVYTMLHAITRVLFFSLFVFCKRFQCYLFACSLLTCPLFTPRASQVPNGPVNHPRGKVLEDPQLKVNELVYETIHPWAPAPIRQARPAAKFSNAPFELRLVIFSTCFLRQFLFSWLLRSSFFFVGDLKIGQVPCSATGGAFARGAARPWRGERAGA